MAKTSVNELVTRIQRRADYTPSQTDAGLNTLTLDILNDAIKLVKQLFMDHNLVKDISDTDSFTTTVNVATAALSGTPDLDEPLNLYNIADESSIQFIPFTDFRLLYPAPLVNTATLAIHFSIFDNNIYLGPTPSATGTQYDLDYFKLITDLAAGGTMPFVDKYDPLFIAMGRAELMSVIGNADATTIAIAERRVITLQNKLIINAAKNIGMNNQTKSRRVYSTIGPRKVVT